VQLQAAQGTGGSVVNTGSRQTGSGGQSAQR
jgi:hypothetical protein